MIPPATPPYPDASTLLEQAARGDTLAATRALGQLGSPNPWLRQFMRATVQSSAAPELWRQLLVCLALHRRRSTSASAPTTSGSSASRPRARRARAGKG